MIDLSRNAGTAGLNVGEYIAQTRNRRVLPIFVPLYVLMITHKSQAQRRNKVGVSSNMNHPTSDSSRGVRNHGQRGWVFWIH